MQWIRILSVILYGFATISFLFYSVTDWGCERRKVMFSKVKKSDLDNDEDMAGGSAVYIYTF